MSGDIMRHEDMPLGEIARAAAASRFFNVDPAQAIVKILMGRELGVAPVASLTDIHIIKGKPVVGAGMIAARIKSSEKYDYRERRLCVEHGRPACESCAKSAKAKWRGKEEVCCIEFFERGESIGFHSYTMEMAQRAGNAGKDNYKRHAQDMLFARAISTGYKRHCPDAFLSKVYTPGEIPEGSEERQALPVSISVSSSQAEPRMIEARPEPAPTPTPIEQEPIVKMASEILEAEPVTPAAAPKKRRRRRAV